MATLEGKLSALDDKAQATAKGVKGLAAALRRLTAETRVGRIGEIEKALPVVERRAQEVAESARDLAASWEFDAPRYLADRRFVAELADAARSTGLELFERDGRIYCFPLLLRVEPGESALRVGRKLERRLRPRELVRLLAAAQKRPQRFTEAQFLELLHKTYRRIVGPDWRRMKQGAGPVVALVDLHDTLTLLPGSDYPIEEFGRDLLLLDRRPDLRTRDGSRFELPKSTIGKGRMGRVVVYDEKGQERLYIGVRFVKGG